MAEFFVGGEGEDGGSGEVFDVDKTTVFPVGGPFRFGIFQKSIFNPFYSFITPHSGRADADGVDAGAQGEEAAGFFGQ